MRQFLLAVKEEVALLNALDNDENAKLCVVRSLRHLRQITQALEHMMGKQAFELSHSNGTELMVPLNIAMSPSMWSRLREIAAENGGTVEEVISFIIAIYTYCKEESEEEDSE